MNRPARNPLTIARRRLKGTRAACWTLLLVSGLWALWPVRMPTISAREFAAGHDPAPASSSLALDLSGFNAPVFTLPPTPKVEVAASPPALPPPPFKAQLLGIERVEGDIQAFRAVMYDPEMDKIVHRGTGDSVMGRTIVSVTEKEVSVKLGQGTTTLSLRPKAGAP